MFRQPGTSGHASLRLMHESDGPDADDDARAQKE